MSVDRQYHVPSDQYVARVEAPRPVAKIHRQYQRQHVFTSREIMKIVAYQFRVLTHLMPKCSHETIHITT